MLANSVGMLAEQQPNGQNHLALFVAELHGDEPHRQRSSWALVLLSLDVFLGRLVQHDFRLRHPQLSRLGVVLCLPCVAEQAVVPQLPGSRSTATVFLPFDPLIISAHEELVSGLVPAAVMIHRIGLAVDDVQQRLGHAPRAALACIVGRTCSR